MHTQVFEFDVAIVKSKVKELNLSRRQNHYFSEAIGHDVVLEMVAIEAGSFLMGSPGTAMVADDSEKPQHSVTLQPFFVGKYPITQAQWRAVATLEPISLPLKLNPSKFQGADRPVERVSWFEAVEFCQRLSRLTGRRYQLPSEAQWEYACRGGTTTPFHFGKRIPKHLVNFHGSLVNGIKEEGTTSVGKFGVANAFGLYDMHGNVYEWCLDHWHDDYKGAPTDGSAWYDEQQEERVIRGGFWLSYAQHCRSAYRDSSEPEVRSGVIGFRVVCEAVEVSD
jgi:formylglycine-generating enzyme required for sulfatase activity